MRGFGWDGERTYRLAGWAAIGAALLLAGSLKAPDRPAGALTAAWNLLLLPAAAVLWHGLRPRARRLVDAASAAGIGAALLGAAASLGGWGGLDPVWIGLGMGWWLGIGWPLRRAWKWLGWATLALGLAAGLDLAVRLARPLSAGWFFLGALRLPMTLVWIGWLGALMITRPGSLGSLGSLRSLRSERRRGDRRVER